MKAREEWGEKWDAIFSEPKLNIMSDEEREKENEH